MAEYRKPVEVYGVQFRSVSRLCKILGLKSVQAESVLKRQYGSLEAMASKVLGLDSEVKIVQELRRRLAREGDGLPPAAPALSDEERLLCKALMLEGLKSFDLVYFNNLTQSNISTDKAVEAINKACKLI